MHLIHLLNIFKAPHEYASPPPHRHLIQLFNDHELELLISGLPDIDLDDLRANTDYNGYTATAPVIRWV